jgi:hypothetical protein
VLGFVGYKLFAQSTYDEALDLIRRTPVYDINRDGEISCIDHAVCVWKANPNVFDLVYIESMPSGNAHLTVLFTDYWDEWWLMEAQSSEKEFDEFWGGWRPQYIYLVTSWWVWDQKDKRFGELMLYDAKKFKRIHVSEDR